MTVKENELTIIPYTAAFEEKFIIEDNINLLLDEISIYGCVESDSLGKVLDKKVNFDIRVINDKKVIYPIADYETYLLNAERLEKATIVKIKASDIIDKTVGHNEDFIFVLKENENE